MKYRYFTLGFVILVSGLVAVWQIPSISRFLYTNTVTIEIPRREFRLLVKRVWRGDVVRLDFDVLKGEDEISILVERAHFYIGSRQETGAPTNIFTAILYGPNLVMGSESVSLDIDVEGHLNIIFDNTQSFYPKTITVTTVFEKSTNVEYGAKIFRNLCLVVGAVSFFYGIVQNYEEIESRLVKTKKASFT